MHVYRQFLLGTLLVGLGLATGCSDRPADPLLLDPALAVPEKVDFYRTMVRGKEKEEVIRKVRESVPDGEAITVDEWVAGHIHAVHGEALFQTWSGSRTAPNQYEVRFTFTEVSEDGFITFRGYAWPLDIMLGLVGGRRELTEQELDRLFHKNSTYDRLNQRLGMSGEEPGEEEAADGNESEAFLEGDP